MKKTMSLKINGKLYKGSQLIGGLVECPNVMNRSNSYDIGFQIEQVLDDKRLLVSDFSNLAYVITKDQITKFFPLKKNGEWDGL